MNTLATPFLNRSSSFLQVTRTRVICPCASEKLMYNVVNTPAPLFFIGSSSFLQVRRTTIQSRPSLKFDLIGPRTAE